MKHRGVVILTVGSLLCVAGKAVQAQDGEWTVLLSGADQTGWEQVGSGGFVSEGDVVRTEGGMGLLWYTGQTFSDVEIKIVYRNPGGRNSGVFIRIPEPPSDVWTAVHKGYEVQIDDRGDDYHVTGVLYSFTRALSKPSLPGEWNTMNIRLEGDRTMVYVNGKVVTDHTEGDPVKKKPKWKFWQFWGPKPGPRPIVGYVGLQNHSKKDVVYFREIAVRPLEEPD